MLMKSKILFPVITITMILILSCVPVIANSRDTFIDKQYVRYCEEIGRKYHVSPEFLEAMIETESAGKPDVVGGGCVGLMQVDPVVHADRMKKLGVTNIYDPYSNILVGADLVVELFETYGDDTAMVLMMYNGSRNAEQKAEQWDFTDYAKKIMDRARELEEVHGKLRY